MESVEKESRKLQLLHIHTSPPPRRSTIPRNEVLLETVRNLENSRLDSRGFLGKLDSRGASSTRPRNLDVVTSPVLLKTAELKDKSDPLGSARLFTTK